MAPLDVEHDERGVLERRFELTVADQAVPGLLWTPPDATGPRPVVLIGHGGTRHKRYRYVLSLARRLVRHQGWAAAALDAPGHGERRPAHLDSAERVGPLDPDEVIGEWKACLDFLRELPEVGPSPVGYWGMSMGASLGIPFLAAEPRVDAAVIGLMSGRTARIVDDAQRISCPVLFLVQWDDRSIPRPGALDLFDALGASDKRLHAHPGDHQDLPEEELEQSEQFLARYLTAPSRSSARSTAASATRS